MPQATRGHPQGVYTNDPGQYVISTVPCGLVSLTLDIVGKGVCHTSVFDCAAIPPAGEKMVVKLLAVFTVSYSPCKPDACQNGLVLTVAGDGAKVTLSIE